MARETTNKKTILVFALCILLIPFLSIAGIVNTISADLYQAWQIVALLVLALLIFVKLKDIKYSRAITIFVAYQFVIIMSSFLHHGFNPGIIMSIVTSMLIFILIQTDYYREIITAISIIVVFALIINIPSMISNLNVKGAEFFIGGKNALGLFLVPGAFLLLIRSQEINGRITKLTLFVALICLGFVFVGASGTGIIVAACTLLLLFISKKFKVKKSLLMGVVLGVYALFIVFPDDFFVTDYWLRFTDYLGKDSSLTSRTYIWSLVRDIVVDNWLFGSGRGTSITYMSAIGEWQTIYEAHNFVLEILMEGGVVALALFGMLLIKALKGLDMSNVAHKMVFMALCIIMINGLTESTINNFFVIVMIGIACRFANERAELRNEKWIADSKN